MSSCKPFFIVTTFIIAIAVVSMSLDQEKNQRSKAVEMVAQLYAGDMQRLDAFLKEYPNHFYNSTYEIRKSQYEELARRIKRIECMFFYYHPQLALDKFFQPAKFEMRDFGPPFPDSWIIAGPFGIETDSEMKKMDPDRIAFTKIFIPRAANNLRKVIEESNCRNDCEAMNDADILEALRLQIMRISTVGIANGDMTVEPAGMPGLEGEYMAWSEMIKIYLDQLSSSKATLKKQMLAKLDEGQRILYAKPEFRKFNRMGFLTEILIPLSIYFDQLQKALKVDLKTSFSAVYLNSKHIYEANILNPDYFAPGSEAYLTKAKAELGKFLFFDPILSDNNKRSCASCHKPQFAFTDSLKKAVKFEFGDLPRNTPTVINAAYQKVQFWDLRASSLEDQLDSVINSPDELHSSFERVIDRINSSTEYRTLFYAAFPETKKTGIQRRHVKIAIACYERTLTGLNSRFDQYVRGDKTRLSESEIHGFNLFMGQAKCATCHYAPLFSGPRPPEYNFTDHRSLGIPVKDTMEIFQLDPDTGFSKLTKNPFQHFSFKVPTVRNAELTAPYMHNGVYKTLEQVINFYNHAAGNKLRKDYGNTMKGLPFFMVLPDSLDLNEQDKKDLVLFLKALTDTTAIKNVPTRLPELGEKYAALNKRKIGGEY